MKSCMHEYRITGDSSSLFTVNLPVLGCFLSYVNVLPVQSKQIKTSAFGDFAGCSVAETLLPMQGAWV